MYKHKNLRDVPQIDIISDQQEVTRGVKWAVSNLGVTGHFLIAGALAMNITLGAKPIAITLPNRDIIKSTHTCNLDIPWMPGHVPEVHIVPSLAHHKGIR